MDLEFHLARPEDAAAVVPLIYSSGPAVIEYVFADAKRGSATDFLSFAFRDGAGELGFRNHSIVMHAGQVVGAGACFSGDVSFRFLLAGVRQLWTHYGIIRAPRVIRRALQMESMIKPPQETMHYIGHLGVPEEWRGRGIGRQLVEHFLEQGRQKKRLKAVLDVSVENARAQALYEQIGFRTTEELVSTIPGVPNHRRLEMPLS